MKPVDAARLAKTVERLWERRSEGAKPGYSPQPIVRVPCLGARSIKLVPVRDIELVRSGEAGVYVVVAAGEYYTELTLGVLEARAGLLRCHKQYLVNVDHIDEISLGENSLGVIKTKTGKTVPVSRRHLSRLRSALGL